MSEITRVYELGYLLVPQTPEGSLEEKVTALGSLCSGGEKVLSSSTPEYIDLAYTIDVKRGSAHMKYSQAYFGFIKFEQSPEGLEALKKKLDGDTDIIRYILVKTSAQNAVVFKKPKNEPKRESLDEIEVTDEELASDDAGVDDIVAAHEALPDLDVPLVDENQE